MSYGHRRKSLHVDLTVVVTAREVEAAKSLYYQVAGWDGNGYPTRAKLEELAPDWVADELSLHSMPL